MRAKTKNTIRTAHKYLGLSLGLIWLLQAMTGVVLVFHRELDDWTAGVHSRPLNLQHIAATVDALHATYPEDRITDLVATGGAANAFDLYIVDPKGHTRIARLEGTGEVVITRPYDFAFFQRGVFQILLQFHTMLFSEPTGRLVIGTSGFFLLLSVIFGLQMAWPGRGQWRQRLLPARQQNSTMTWLSWHRALGLWFALPALVLLTAGILLGWAEPLKARFGGFAPPPKYSLPPHATPVGIAEAAAVAMQRYPGARLTVAEFPSPDHPYYRFRLLPDSEPRRVFGDTVVYVAAGSPTVIGDYDVRTAPFAALFLMDTYPAHTGEWIGLPGRLLAFVTGLLLIVLILLGAQYWLVKRRKIGPVLKPD